MPPTHQLATPCRYGYNCTRPDCFYTHPPGMKKEQKQLCSFGRSCFRKVCYLEHPAGRMMDQLRPALDQCAACVLVRPAELARVSAAFQAAFPAPADGKERCDFVVAVPLSTALKDWKIYRGISSTGTPDGTPSEPGKIRLFPRTRKGERLLQDPANRVGMRWSPTPCRPWKTLERMATHDQHWEESLEYYVLCAGYKSTTGKSGVCMELMVTGVVKTEDGGDGRKAGERVAREVMGLPGSSGQRWFVFHVSRPDDPDEESQFVTVKTTVDVAQLPALPIRPLQWPSAAAVPGPRAPTTPSAARPPPPPPAAAAAPAAKPTPLPLAGPASGPAAVAAKSAAAAAQRAAVINPAAAPTILATPAYSNATPTSVAALQYGVAPPSYASTSPPASTDSELGSSTLSFGSYKDGVAARRARARAATGAPLPRSAFPLGSGGGSAGGVGQGFAVSPTPAAASKLVPAAPEAVGVVGVPVVAAGDELSELLAGLNMTKYRPKFDSKKVDFKTLKMMTEEDELSGIGIPLGPRIKLMKELGIERPFT